MFSDIVCLSPGSPRSFSGEESKQTPYEVTNSRTFSPAKDKNQLGRRNLNPDTMSLIRGRIYNRTKKAVGRPENNSDKKSELTAAKLAADHGVTSRTIERDGQFTKAVESVSLPFAECTIRTDHQQPDGAGPDGLR